MTSAQLIGTYHNSEGLSSPVVSSKGDKDTSDKLIFAIEASKSI